MQMVPLNPFQVIAFILSEQYSVFGSKEWPDFEMQKLGLGTACDAGR